MICLSVGPDVTPTPTPQPNPNPQPTIEVTIEDHNIGIYEVGSTVRYNCSARSQLAPRVRPQIISFCLRSILAIKNNIMTFLWFEKFEEHEEKKIQN